MNKVEFYELFADIACRPRLYRISNINELSSYMNGYFGAIFNEGTVPTDPPISQFSTWLSRRYGVGHSSMSWDQIILEIADSESKAMNLFSDAICSFAMRKRVVVATSMLRSHHRVTCDFEGSVIHREGAEYVEVKIGSPPDRAKIVKYLTDDGWYLEYEFDQYQSFREYYLPSIESAQWKARNDFEIAESDWQFLERSKLEDSQSKTD